MKFQIGDIVEVLGDAGYEIDTKVAHAWYQAEILDWDSNHTGPDGDRKWKIHWYGFVKDDDRWVPERCIRYPNHQDLFLPSTKVHKGEKVEVLGHLVCADGTDEPGSWWEATVIADQGNRVDVEYLNPFWRKNSQWKKPKKTSIRYAPDGRHTTEKIAELTPPKKSPKKSPSKAMPAKQTPKQTPKKTAKAKTTAAAPATKTKKADPSNVGKAKKRRQSSPTKKRGAQPDDGVVKKKKKKRVVQELPDDPSDNSQLEEPPLPQQPTHQPAEPTEFTTTQEMEPVDGEKGEKGEDGDESDDDVVFMGCKFDMPPLRVKIQPEAHAPSPIAPPVQQTPSQTQTTHSEPPNQTQTSEEQNQKPPTPQPPQPTPSPVKSEMMDVKPAVYRLFGYNITVHSTKTAS